MDFTLKIYIHLLKTLKTHNYSFLPFYDYIQLNKQTPSPSSSSYFVGRSPLRRTKSEALAKENRPLIILRHDVDKLPQNALLLAQIEHELSIKGTYYFRAIPASWDEKIIRKMHDLGHEIGYHYENLTTCSGDMNIAIEDFKYNLERLRNITSVSTICMHGSPRSKWDSKDLWKKYNYKDFGIIGEPYLDVDFSNVLYLTDTGRRWNGERVNVRDKISNRKDAKTQRMLSKKYNFRSTFDIIKAAENGELPDKIMMTFHPQRWSDKLGPWVKELVWQNVKNVGKWGLVKIRQRAEGRRL